jgi:hypothetical protein
MPHDRNARSNVRNRAANGVLIVRVAAARALGERSRMNADLHGRVRRIEGQVGLDRLRQTPLSSGTGEAMSSHELSDAFTRTQ